MFEDKLDITKKLESRSIYNNKKNNDSFSSSSNSGASNSNESSPKQKAKKVLDKTRKEPTLEDVKRYQNYVGQKWKGKCKWFNVSKGFGFLIPDHPETKEHEDDVFVHQSVLQMPGFRSLGEGEEIEFIVRLGRNGLEAEQVTGINGASIQGHVVHPIGRRNKNKIRCYNCGVLGQHKASKCQKIFFQDDQTNGNCNGKKGGDNNKACYHCHSTKHLLGQCPAYAENKNKHVKKEHKPEPSQNENKTYKSSNTNKKKNEEKTLIVKQ